MSQEEDWISLEGYEPEEFGFDPQRFPTFRGEQIEAGEEFLNNPDKRFYVFNMPPGCGKALAAGLIAKCSGVQKAVITTPLKGHQEQYVKTLGLADIRGKANYECDGGSKNCKMGVFDGCKLINEQKECCYQRAVQTALGEQVYTTNISWWIASNVRRGLDHVIPADETDLLIIDEADAAFDALSSAVQVVLKESSLKAMRISYDKGEDIDLWVAMARKELDRVQEEATAAVKAYRDKRTQANREHMQMLDDLAEALGKLCMMSRQYWVCELEQGTKWGRKWKFDCIWPGGLAESRLFLGIKKIVLMSGTVKPYHAKLLGIKPEEMHWKEWPRVFPAPNSPVYFIPSYLQNGGPAIRLGNKSTEKEWKAVVETADRILDSRQDRKAFIDTVSYSRQQQWAEWSRHSKNFWMNTGDPESESAMEVADGFRAAEPPAILVSPSFSVGWDFPGRQLEVIILPKVAFADTRSKLMKARKDRSQVYIDGITVTRIVQASLRGMRFMSDRCEIFVLDGHIVWFWHKSKGLAPRYFDIRTVKEIPSPGKRAPEL